VVSFLVVTHSQDFMVYRVIIAIYFHQDHKMNFLWMPARAGMTGILSFPRKRESMKTRLGRLSILQAEMAYVY
jgi:hypothetical protein